MDIGIEGIEDVEEIGSGGSSIVYRARQVDLDRFVAVKVLTIRFGAGDDAERRRFAREQRALGRLSDLAGIVPLYASGFTQLQQPYLIMPYYESRSLQERLDADGSLAWGEACALMATVGRAVQRAHEHNVLHRDIKPANIMIDRDGRPLIGDFGVARLLGSTTMFQSRALLATPAYSPPEVFAGEEASVAVDVYGLGAALFALLNGAPAFMSQSGDMNVLALMRRVDFDPVPDLRPVGVPDPVAAVIERSMAKDPVERHASALRWVADLEAATATATAPTEGDGAVEASAPALAPVVPDQDATSPGGGEPDDPTRDGGESDDPTPGGVAIDDPTQEAVAIADTTSDATVDERGPTGSTDGADDRPAVLPTAPSGEDPVGARRDPGSRAAMPVDHDRTRPTDDSDAAPGDPRPAPARDVALLRTKPTPAPAAARQHVLGRAWARGRRVWSERPGAVVATALVLVVGGLALWSSMTDGDDGDASDEVVAPPSDPEEEDPDDVIETAPDEIQSEEPGGDPRAPAGDGPLVIGTVLPESGGLASLGVPQMQAVALAIDDVNAAGGVLGNDVRLIPGDSGADPELARRTVATAVSQGADAIVGAALSTVSEELITTLSDDGIVQCSASNTSPVFTDHPDNDFYVRTAPPEEAVAPALAETVVDDGFRDVAIAARADDLGSTLAQLTERRLRELGASVAEIVSYDPTASSFDAEIDELTASGADAVVVIGSLEAATLIRQAVEAGVPTGSMYTTVFGPTLPEDVGLDIEGLGVLGVGGDVAFSERLNESVDTPGNLLYGAQAYDCVIILALAAEVASSDDPGVFVHEVADVTTGGIPCASFPECKELVAAGEDIDYEGVSGPLEITGTDPAFARYTIGEFRGGELVVVGSRDVDLSAL